MIRYQLPDTEELIRLGEQHQDAVTIYVTTDPTPEGRDRARTAVKSGVDEGIRTLRAAGRGQAAEDALRAQWTEISADFKLWGSLSRSLVVLLAPGVVEEFILPNELVNNVTVSDHFDLSQLVRAVTTPQQAFALTVSPNGWNLWQASPTTRVEELELVGDHPADAADATNRMTIRGRQYSRRLGGDEGQKVLLERYGKVVADAVTDELRHVDPNGRLPLFVFGNDPVSSMVRGNLSGRDVVAVPGAADELKPEQIDAAIRSRIGELTNATVNELAERIGNGFTSGLAVTDLAQLARAAVMGAVSTMIFDMTKDLRGHLDDVTGEIAMDADGGVDLLSRIAVVVLKNRGDVLAVRTDDLTTSIWNGTVLAGLRHSLAG